ncbi:hypothetical protein GC197_10540 [bacterium]|nr:hypothetical protein [bacterium]
MKFSMTLDYDNILNQLFQVGDDGRIEIGWAKSREAVGTLDGLQESTLFSDYIMEGFVTYYLRLVRTADGCVLEVRLTGTNRDQYIPFTVRDYIKWAGIEAEFFP